MIRVRDIRASDKDAVEWGKWDGGKMPASAFPLSRRRARSFRLGTVYRWRIIRFQACGNQFRLLLAFSLAKEQYRAILAIEWDRDLTVLASYEFHGTHPGWHLHAACDDVAQVPRGVLIGPWQRRIPRARTKHRSVEFQVRDDDTALEVAARFFRLHKVAGQLPL